MKKEVIIYERGYRVTKNGKILNPANVEINGYTNPLGYIEISHKHGGKNLKVKAHRLQAFQKYGEMIYENGVIVRHLNDIKTDNCFDNIAIGTPSDNVSDIPESKRAALAIIRGLTNRKYNYEKVKSFYDSCRSYKKTMNRFDISSKATLTYIIKRTA